LKLSEVAAAATTAEFQSMTSTYCSHRLYSHSCVPLKSIHVQYHRFRLQPQLYEFRRCLNQGSTKSRREFDRLCFLIKQESKLILYFFKVSESVNLVLPFRVQFWIDNVVKLCQVSPPVGPRPNAAKSSKIWFRMEACTFQVDDRTMDDTDVMVDIVLQRF
jgi:hypothetical protein